MGTVFALTLEVDDILIRSQCSAVPYYEIVEIMFRFSLSYLKNLHLDRARKKHSSCVDCPAGPNESPDHRKALAELKLGSYMTDEPGSCRLAVGTECKPGVAVANVEHRKRFAKQEGAVSIAQNKHPFLTRHKCRDVSST